MRKLPTFALIALGLYILAAPARPAPETDPDALIARGTAALMGPGLSKDALISALDDLLDASVLILPKSPDSEEFRQRIEVAKKTMVERTPLNDKVRQYIGFAYRLASGGKAWRVPDEMANAYRQKDIMAQAQKICQNLIDSALAERKAGRNDQAALNLLGLVLMVITPVGA